MKLSELQGIAGAPADGKPRQEADHFYTCSHCGQQVDKRQLMEVLYHETANHEPAEKDS